MVIVFLSHDVDWGIKGPTREYIMERKDRFDDSVIRNIKIKNPYYNIPEILAIEQLKKVRSTFFFRTSVMESPKPPPTYNTMEYQKDIQFMVKNGWEIGLHSNPWCLEDIKLLRREKEAVEKVAGCKIIGNRSHYSIITNNLWSNLVELDFEYDASPKPNIKELDMNDFGYFVQVFHITDLFNINDRVRKDLTIFPISFVDVFISHMVKDENEVLPLLEQALQICEKQKKNPKIMTVSWHNCSLKMKIGRMYEQVLDYLIRKKCKIVTGKELVELINNA